MASARNSWPNTSKRWLLKTTFRLVMGPKPNNQICAAKCYPESQEINNTSVGGHQKSTTCLSRAPKHERSLPRNNAVTQALPRNWVPYLVLVLGTQKMLRRPRLSEAHTSEPRESPNNPSARKKSPNNPSEAKESPNNPFEPRESPNYPTEPKKSPNNP